MGNNTKQIEAREERKERDKTSRETLGKFSENADTGGFVLVGTGLFFTFALAMVGYKVLNSKIN